MKNDDNKKRILLYNLKIHVFYVFWTESIYERERERERERHVYLQLDELDSNTYNTYNINIIQYNTYNIVGIQVGFYLLCLLPIAQSPWY